MSDGPSGRRLGLIQLHLAVLLAGGSGLFAKTLAVGPEVLTAGRSAFGTATLLAFAAIAGRRLVVRPDRDAAGLLLCGVVLAAHWVTFFHAIQVSTVAVGLLAFSTFPLFTTLLEPAVFGERLHAADVTPAVIVTVGLMLVVPSFDAGDGLVRGAFWGVVSALLFATLAIASRFYNARQPVLAIAFHQQLGAALATAPFALPGASSLSSRDWTGLVALGVVFTAVGQGLAVASLRRLRARTVSVVFGLEPVYAIALAWLLLHESPSPRTLLGGLLICGAAALACSRRDRPFESGRELP